MNALTAEFDFRTGNVARVCRLCFQAGKQVVKRSGADAAAGGTQQAKLLADELQTTVREVGTLQDSLKESQQRSRDAERENLLLRDKVRGLEAAMAELRTSHEVALDGLEDRLEASNGALADSKKRMASYCLVAPVYKRKVRADQTMTDWKERLVVATSRAIYYYKLQEPLGLIDLSEVRSASACVPSAQTKSPLKNAAAVGQAGGLQIITSEGESYEFAMKGSDASATLWLDHVGAAIQSAQLGRLPSGDLGPGGHTARRLDYGGDPEENGGTTTDGAEGANGELRASNSDASGGPFKMGWLMKQPGQTMGFWQKRWFVVCDGTLAYYKTKSIVNPIQQLSLANADVRQVGVPGRRPNLCFQLYVPTVSRLYVMEADSAETMGEWIAAIQGAAQYAKDASLGEGEIDAAQAGADTEGSSDEDESIASEPNDVVYDSM